MSALSEAQKYKRAIEDELTRRLEEFNVETGLHISEIGIETIDNTCMGDPNPRYKYRVWAEIKV